MITGLPVQGDRVWKLCEENKASSHKGVLASASLAPSLLLIAARDDVCKDRAAPKHHVCEQFSHFCKNLCVSMMKKLTIGALLPLLLKSKLSL